MTSEMSSAERLDQLERMKLKHKQLVAAEAERLAKSKAYYSEKRGASNG